MSTAVTEDDKLTFGMLFWLLEATLHTLRYQLLPTVECVLIISTICLMSCITIRIHCLMQFKLPTSIYSALDLGKWRNNTSPVSKLYN